MISLLFKMISLWKNLFAVLNFIAKMWYQLKTKVTPYNFQRDIALILIDTIYEVISTNSKTRWDHIEYKMKSIINETSSRFKDYKRICPDIKTSTLEHFASAPSWVDDSWSHTRQCLSKSRWFEPTVRHIFFFQQCSLAGIRLYR